MLVLLLLALRIISVDCRSLSSNKDLRAIDSTDAAGFVTDGYAAGMSSIDSAPDPFDASKKVSFSSNPEDVTKSNPDDSFRSIAYPETPDGGLPRVVADDRYPPRPTCLPGWRLACCMPQPWDESSQEEEDPLNGFPEIPEIPKCIWEMDFNPVEDPLHFWISDWCNKENLMCCIAAPKRTLPVWEECVPLNLPEPKPDPSRAFCRLHPHAPQKRASDGCQA